MKIIVIVIENYYCYVEMSNKHNSMLKCNHGEKSVKVPFIIYSRMESLLAKMGRCHNSPKELSTTKINKHPTSGYSLFTYCSFDVTKNKLDYYRGEDSMKKIYKDLKDHATKIINYEEKEMIALTYEEN